MDRLFKCLVLSVVLGVGMAWWTALPAGATFPGNNGLIAFVDQAGGGSHIFTIDADGTNRTDLGRGSHPAWSADGASIVFTRSRQIYVMSATGQNVTNLSNGRTGDREPTWAPDGRRIAFIHSGHVWVMRAGGAGAHAVETNGVPDRSPTWSPDGSTIAVARCCYTTPRFDRFGFIVSMAPNGTDHRVLFGDNPRDKLNHFGTCGAGFQQPDWSSSGTQLAFTLNFDGSDGGGEHIEHGSIATAKYVGFPQASEGPVDGSYNSDPSWSPDRLRVAYVSLNADLSPCQGAFARAHAAIHVVTRDPFSDETLVIGRQPAWQPVPSG
jgi:Tol biopolymer transport system component